MRRYDQDNDGMLTSEEIAKAFQSGSVNITAEQVRSDQEGWGGVGEIMYLNGF
jgi:hypothetical protein